MSNRNYLVDVFWNILPFLVLFLFLFQFHQKISLLNYADDAYISTIQENLSLTETLINAYNNWSGRLSSITAAYLILNYPIQLWRMVNAILVTGLYFNLCFILLGNKFWLRSFRVTAATIWAICFGFGLINVRVLCASSFWITGAFFYLWPIFAGSLALIPFSQRLFHHSYQITSKSAIWFIFPLAAAIFAGLGNQQVAFVILCLMFAANLLLYISTKEVEPYLLLITGVTLISFIILISAPGNQVRYGAEIITNFPNFQQLTFGQRLLMGLNYILDKIININRFLFILLFALLAISLRRDSNSRPDKLLGEAVTVLAAFLFLSSLSLDFFQPEFQSWFQEKFYTFNINWGEAFPVESILPYLIWIPVLASIPFLLYKSCRDCPIDGTVLAFLFIMGILSLALLILSPTIYASYNRVVAVYSVILLFILGTLFNSIKEQVPWSILFAFVALALINLILQEVKWNRGFICNW